MWEDLNTKVHNVRELVAWLDEHKATAEAPAVRDAWDPEATGVMQAPQLDAMLAREQAQAHSVELASVSGSLEAFHVVELLQALSSGDRTGVLELTDGTHFARIYLDNGRINAAIWDDDTGLDPLEALRRAAALAGGNFRFGPPEDRGPPLFSIVTLSTVQVLIELSSVAWQRMGGEDDVDSSMELNLDAFDDPAAARAPEPTPSRGAPAPVDLPPAPHPAALALRMSDPLVPRLRDLTAFELDVLQAVLRHRTLDAVVGSLAGDHDKTRSTVRSLIARGYLVS